MSDNTPKKWVSAYALSKETGCARQRVAYWAEIWPIPTMETDDGGKVFYDREVALQAISNLSRVAIYRQLEEYAAKEREQEPEEESE